MAILYDNKALTELTNEQLIKACEGIWNQKQQEIDRLEATIKGYETLVKGSYPKHVLWRDFGWVVWATCVLMFVVFFLKETP